MTETAAEAEWVVEGEVPVTPNCQLPVCDGAVNVRVEVPLPPVITEGLKVPVGP